MLPADCAGLDRFRYSARSDVHTPPSRADRRFCRPGHGREARSTACPTDRTVSKSDIPHNRTGGRSGRHGSLLGGDLPAVDVPVAAGVSPLIAGLMISP